MTLVERLERIYRPVSLSKALARIGKLSLLDLKPRRSRADRNSLKIAFFTDTYLPNVDGVVNSIVAYRSELERRGHHVCVLAPGSRDDKRNNADPGVHFYTSVKFPPYPQYKIPLFPFSARTAVKRQRADLVHSHALTSMGVAAVVTAKELGLPLVGTFHTLLPKAGKFISENRIWELVYSSIAWGAVREFYRPFDLVTVPTRTAEKMLNEQGVENTMVVPNGINLKKFSPGKDGSLIRDALGIPKSKKIILTAGRLSYEKNVDVLIKAAKLVLKEEPDAFFIIQGDGPARANCERLARKLKLQGSIAFPGFVKDFEVPFFYAAADVFATASTFETQGLALVEAMAAGKVCVGANAMAIPEVVSHGKNGFLFEPYNEHDCAQKLLEALRLSQKGKAAMQASASKAASQFSAEKSTDRLLEAYAKVL